MRIFEGHWGILTIIHIIHIYSLFVREEMPIFSLHFTFGYYGLTILIIVLIIVFHSEASILTFWCIITLGNTMQTHISAHTFYRTKFRWTIISTEKLYFRNQLEISGVLSNEKFSSFFYFLIQSFISNFSRQNISADKIFGSKSGSC